MKHATLADLYLDQLQDIHSCEVQLIKALPKLAEAAHHPKLRAALEAHLEQTRTHLGRVDRILAAMNQDAGRKVCAATTGLVEEAEDMTDAHSDGEVRDAGLICATQKIEHYEIATYGCLRTFASLLGRKSDVELLGTTLIEEKKADRSLTALALSVINAAALDEVTDGVTADAATNGKTPRPSA